MFVTYVTKNDYIHLIARIIFLIRFFEKNLYFLRVTLYLLAKIK